MVLREEIYATAAIAGGITYVGLEALEAPGYLAIAVSLVTTLGLRLAAIHWGLALPTFAWVEIAPAPPATQDESTPPAPARKKYRVRMIDRKSTRLNSSHVRISYAVFCLKKKSQQHVTDFALALHLIR